MSATCSDEFGRTKVSENDGIEGFERFSPQGAEVVLGIFDFFVRPAAGRPPGCFLLGAGAAFQIRNAQVTSCPQSKAGSEVGESGHGTGYTPYDFEPPRRLVSKSSRISDCRDRNLRAPPISSGNGARGRKHPKSDENRSKKKSARPSSSCVDNISTVSIWKALSKFFSICTIEKIVRPLTFEISNTQSCTSPKSAKIGQNRPIFGPFSDHFRAIKNKKVSLSTIERWSRGLIPFNLDRQTT